MQCRTLTNTIRRWPCAVCLAGTGNHLLKPSGKTCNRISPTFSGRNKTPDFTHRLPDFTPRRPKTALGLPLGPLNLSKTQNKLYNFDSRNAQNTCELKRFAATTTRPPTILRSIYPPTGACNDVQSPKIERATTTGYSVAKA